MWSFSLKEGEGGKEEEREGRRGEGGEEKGRRRRRREGAGEEGGGGGGRTARPADSLRGQPQGPQHPTPPLGAPRFLPDPLGHDTDLGDPTKT